MTQSPLLPNAGDLISSLLSLFNLFLSTARFASLLAMASPSSGFCWLTATPKYSAQHPFVAGRVFNSSAILLDFNALKQLSACVPLSDGHLARSGRLSFSFWRGNRGFFCGVLRRVDTFFSWLVLRKPSIFSICLGSVNLIQGFCLIFIFLGTKF